MTRERMPALTDRLRLGTRGLTVSPFCIGIVGDPKVIPAAYEAGINFVFVTADMHWPLYENTRRGIRDLLAMKPAARDDLVIAAVAYVTQREFCSFPFVEVSAELGVKGLDVLLAGGAYGFELGNRLPIYDGHRERGHVGARAMGVSFHDRVAAKEQINAGAIDIAFVRYNPAHPRASQDLFPHLSRPRKPLVYNFTNTFGLMTTDEQYASIGVAADYWRPHPTDYYRFALREPQLDGLLIAPPHPGAMTELVDAMAKGPLDDEDHQYLLDLGELVRGKARVKQPA
jgi:aryl-alcohol dehydrogenase-like predicted oxidoreductase